MAGDSSDSGDYSSADDIEEDTDLLGDDAEDKETLDAKDGNVNDRRTEDEMATSVEDAINRESRDLLPKTDAGRG